MTLNLETQKSGPREMHVVSESRNIAANTNGTDLYISRYFLLPYTTHVMMFSLLFYLTLNNFGHTECKRVYIIDMVLSTDNVILLFTCNKQEERN